MADVRLARPEAGQTQTIPAQSDARYVLDYPSGDGVLARDGDNLNITFDDGATISLENFYTEHNSEALPSFTIDGEEIGAEDFFTAMNEPDLMPAAGPGAGTAPAAGEGGRYHDYDNMSLLDGIDHLWQLDWGMSRAFDWDDNYNGWGETVDTLALNTILTETGQPVLPNSPLDTDTTNRPSYVTRPEQPEQPERPIENVRPEPEPWNPTTPEPTPDPTPEPTPPPTEPEDPETPPPPTEPEDPNTPPPPPTEPGPEIDPGPTDPDPVDPKDPVDPDDPDNPPTPDNPFQDVDPSNNASHIIVDEAAWNASTIPRRCMRATAHMRMVSLAAAM